MERSFFLFTEFVFFPITEFYSTDQPVVGSVFLFCYVFECRVSLSLSLSLSLSHFSLSILIVPLLVRIALHRRNGGLPKNVEAWSRFPIAHWLSPANAVIDSQPASASVTSTLAARPSPPVQPDPSPTNRTQLGELDVEEYSERERERER